MKSVKKTSISVFEEKKSKFICYISPSDTTEQANKLFEQAKKDHPNATHHIPVYRILDNRRIIYSFSDDGEPSKTAGFPVYHILDKQDIINTAVCIVRYFGGIKLGTGGLVKAYSQALLKGLEENTPEEYISMLDLEIEFDFNLTNLIHHYFEKNNLIIVNKIYSEKVYYSTRIPENLLGEFENFCKTYNIVFQTKRN